jgi:predicted ATPase with chaperone activity
VRGVLPIAAHAREAALIPGLEVIPVESLLQLVDRLTRYEAIAVQAPPVLAEDDGPGDMDFVADLLPPGQPLIRRRPFRAPHHTISQQPLVCAPRPPGVYCPAYRTATHA